MENEPPWEENFVMMLEISIARILKGRIGGVWH